MNKRKKIAVISLYDNDNFGNRLQNYATCRLLKKNGNKVYSLKNNVWKNNSNLFHVYCTELYLFFRFIKSFFFKRREFEKKIKFMKFNKNINMTKTFYTGRCYKLNFFDKYFVGSDQVWNPTPDYINDLYTLKNIKSDEKYSIAASFGISELPSKMKDDIRKEFMKFKKISIRENAGLKILDQIDLSNNAEVLVDPTLAITPEEWMRLEKKPKNYTSQKYILNYFLGEIPKERKIQIEKLAKKNNCKIVNILNRNDDYYVSGPEEFLFLERNAELICTDSYHSCVFAIIFHRPFIVFDREQNITSMSSRIDNLLDIFKLNKRRFNGNFLDDVFVTDYAEADNILVEERKKVYSYISECLH